MLNYILKYPLQISPPSASFPYGGAQNITVPDDGTGTPWDYELINDILGFFQKMVTEASITPSGSSETVLASDIYDALDAFLTAIDDKYLPDNVEKLLTNDASVAPGDAFIGSGYKGQQFYGFGAELAQYYGRSATGGIELGSTLGSVATKKLISGAKSATFEQIIEAVPASGTFTPTALTSGGSVTLSVATGSYAKSGKMVTVNAHIEIDTTTASGDTLWIGNLPYSAAYDSQGSIRLTFHTSYPSGNMEKAWIVTGESRITIQGYDGVNGTTTQFPPNLISGTDIYVTMNYLTND